MSDNSSNNNNILSGLGLGPLVPQVGLLGRSMSDGSKSSSHDGVFTGSSSPINSSGSSAFSDKSGSGSLGAVNVNLNGVGGVSLNGVGPNPGGPGGSGGSGFSRANNNSSGTRPNPGSSSNNNNNMKQRSWNSTGSSSSSGNNINGRYERFDRSNNNNYNRDRDRERDRDRPSTNDNPNRERGYNRDYSTNNRNRHFDRSNDSNEHRTSNNYNSGNNNYNDRDRDHDSNNYSNNRFNRNDRDRNNNDRTNNNSSGDRYGGALNYNNRSNSPGRGNSNNNNLNNSRSHHGHPGHLHGSPTLAPLQVDRGAFHALQDEDDDDRDENNFNNSGGENEENDRFARENEPVDNSLGQYTRSQLLEMFTEYQPLIELPPLDLKDIPNTESIVSLQCLEPILSQPLTEQEQALKSQGMLILGRGTYKSASRPDHRSRNNPNGNNSSSGTGNDRESIPAWMDDNENVSTFQISDVAERSKDLEKEKESNKRWINSQPKERERERDRDFKDSEKEKDNTHNGSGTGGAAGSASASGSGSGTSRTWVRSSDRNQLGTRNWRTANDSNSLDSNQDHDDPQSNETRKPRWQRTSQGDQNNNASANSEDESSQSKSSTWRSNRVNRLKEHSPVLNPTQTQASNLPSLQSDNDNQLSGSTLNNKSIHSNPIHGSGSLGGLVSMDFVSEAEDDGRPHKWYYKDPQNEIQGPFAAEEMRAWYDQRYFDLKLAVQSDVDQFPDRPFVPLGVWFLSGKKAFLPSVPDLTNEGDLFDNQSHHKIQQNNTLNIQPQEILQHQHQQRILTQNMNVSHTNTDLSPMINNVEHEDVLDIDRYTQHLHLDDELHEQQLTNNSHNLLNPNNHGRLPLNGQVSIPSLQGPSVNSLHPVPANVVSSWGQPQPSHMHIQNANGPGQLVNNNRGMYAQWSPAHVAPVNNINNNLNVNGPGPGPVPQSWVPGPNHRPLFSHQQMGPGPNGPGPVTGQSSNINFLPPFPQNLNIHQLPNNNSQNFSNDQNSQILLNQRTQAYGNTNISNNAFNPSQAFHFQQQQQRQQQEWQQQLNPNNQLDHQPQIDSLQFNNLNHEQVNLHSHLSHHNQVKQSHHPLQESSDVNNQNVQSQNQGTMGMSLPVHLVRMSGQVPNNNNINNHHVNNPVNPPVPTPTIAPWASKPILPQKTLSLSEIQQQEAIEEERRRTEAEQSRLFALKQAETPLISNNMNNLNNNVGVGAWSSSSNRIKTLAEIQAEEEREQIEKLNQNNISRGSQNTFDSTLTNTVPLNSLTQINAVDLNWEREYEEKKRTAAQNATGLWSTPIPTDINTNQPQATSTLPQTKKPAVTNPVKKLSEPAPVIPSNVSQSVIPTSNALSNNKPTPTTNKPNSNPVSSVPSINNSINPNLATSHPKATNPITLVNSNPSNKIGSSIRLLDETPVPANIAVNNNIKNINNLNANSSIGLAAEKEKDNASIEKDKKSNAVSNNTVQKIKPVPVTNSNPSTTTTISTGVNNASAPVSAPSTTVKSWGVGPVVNDLKKIQLEAESAAEKEKLKQASIQNSSNPNPSSNPTVPSSAWGSRVAAPLSLREIQEREALALAQQQAAQQAVLSASTTTPNLVAPVWSLIAKGQSAQTAALSVPISTMDDLKSSNEETQTWDNQASQTTQSQPAIPKNPLIQALSKQNQPSVPSANLNQTRAQTVKPQSNPTPSLSPSPSNPAGLSLNSTKPTVSGAVGSVSTPSTTIKPSNPNTKPTSTTTISTPTVTNPSPAKSSSQGSGNNDKDKDAANSKGSNNDVDVNAFGGEAMSPEFSAWCRGELEKLTGSTDITLAHYLLTLSSDEEIADNIRHYLGSTPKVNLFIQGFLRHKEFSDEGGDFSSLEGTSNSAVADKKKRRRGGAQKKKE